MGPVVGLRVVHVFWLLSVRVGILSDKQCPTVLETSFSKKNIRKFALAPFCFFAGRSASSTEIDELSPFFSGKSLPVSRANYKFIIEPVLEMFAPRR